MNLKSQAENCQYLHLECQKFTKNKFCSPYNKCISISPTIMNSVLYLVLWWEPSHHYGWVSVRIPESPPASTPLQRYPPLKSEHHHISRHHFTKKPWWTYILLSMNAYSRISRKWSSSGSLWNTDIGFSSGTDLVRGDTAVHSYRNSSSWPWIPLQTSPHTRGTV